MSGEAGRYDALEEPQRSSWSPSKTKVAIGTGGMLVLLLGVAVIAGLTIDVGHHEWKGCGEDYWRRGCRITREGDGYNNFLARAGLLLPRTIHRVLSEEEMGEGRVLFVGDVHGCRDEFLELLEKAKFEAGVDTLILTGDMVDKGPYSIEVIKEVQRLGGLSVRGNHDDSGLAAYDALTRGEEVPEKQEWVKDLEPEDAAWLGQLPWSISLPSHGITVVHAGLVPEVPLDRQLLPDLFHMREVGPGDDTKYRGIEGKPRGQGPPWAQVWDGPQHVVFGHDSHKGLQEEKYATGIDTALVSGNYLTGLMLPGAKSFQEMQANGSAQPMTLGKLHGKFIQVKAKKDYIAAGKNA